MTGWLEMRPDRAVPMPDGRYLWAARRYRDSVVIHVPCVEELLPYEAHAGKLEGTLARPSARLHYDHHLHAWAIHARLGEGFWECPRLGLPKGWGEWDAWVRLAKAYGWPTDRQCVLDYDRGWLAVANAGETIDPPSYFI